MCSGNDTKTQRKEKQLIAFCNYNKEATASLLSLIMKKYHIKHINDPYLNKLLSPATNLYRPLLPWKGIIILSVGLLIIVTIFFLTSIFLSVNIDGYTPQNYVIIFLFWFFIVIGVSSKYYLLFLIMVYQRYAKASTRLKCCCYPSCSQYAIIALHKYGIIGGVYLTIKHCINCKPPGSNEFP